MRNIFIPTELSGVQLKFLILKIRGNWWTSNGLKKVTREFCQAVCIMCLMNGVTKAKIQMKTFLRHPRSIENSIKYHDLVFRKLCRNVFHKSFLVFYYRNLLSKEPRKDRFLIMKCLFEKLFVVIVKPAKRCKKPCLKRRAATSSIKTLESTWPRW